MTAVRNVAKTFTATIALAFASLAGSAHAVSPLGWEIPAPGTPGPLPKVQEAPRVKGISPLGWEIPPVEARGAQGPLRHQDAADDAAEPNLHRRLAGIGGPDTP